MRGCAALGQVRAVASGLTEAGCPVDLAARAGAPDGAPFEWLACDGFAVGTWPPLPTAEIEKCLAEWEMGEVRDRCHATPTPIGRHGTGWHIDAYYEDDLLDVVRADGSRAVRYDAGLVSRLCWPEPSG